MREINRIFIHCTDTPEDKDFDIDTIRKWHTAPPPMGRGWRDIGYHWIVQLDGTIEPGRSEQKAGAHAFGHNTDSIGIAYIGGKGSDGEPKDTRTPRQIEAMDDLICKIRNLYGQHITVHGHNEVSAKLCPCFDVVEDRSKRRR